MLDPDQPLTDLLIPSPDPVQAAMVIRQVAEGSGELLLQLVEQLHQHASPLAHTDPAFIGGLLRAIHVAALKHAEDVLPSLQPEWIAHIATSLPEGCLNQHLLLHLLALLRTDESLKQFTQLLIQSAPAGWMDAGLVISPLMQSGQWNIAVVFPQLLAAMEHASLAAPILDLTNYLKRSGRTETHLASDRVESLNRLLGAVTKQLESFESDPRTFGDDVKTVQDRLAQAVALAVSLCDSLGLIGDPTSKPRLRDASQLKHRRVQSEAAGALARLGDEDGMTQLLALAAEPSARLRVIAYAEELGIADQLPESLTSDEAVAEAEVALWLSKPDRFGIPPSSVTTIDSRRWMWPGFNDATNCFLVQFTYDMGARHYSNVALAGPATYAFACDVADLPIDDIYAIYAGWHAEHDDIFSIAAGSFNAGQQRVVDELAIHLERGDYEELKAELFGVLLDEHAAAFIGSRTGKPVRVITDGLETIALPIEGRMRPLQASDLWNLYKGRKMLRTFNPHAS